MNVTKDFLKLKLRNFTVVLVLCAFAVFSANGQAMPYARTFPKPKTEVEQALKDLQAYTGQKLPIVDGFVGTTQQPLERYERAFYQFSIEVLPGVPAGTIVQVSAKITAWYADKDPAKSGYQILPSNGRLELDLLDRLDEKFGNKPAPGTARSLATSGISVPTPKLNLGGGVNMSPGGGNPIAPPEGAEELNRLRNEREAEEKHMRSLNVELQGLEEVKKNQVHPLNLVTVKRAGTPVLARPGEESRVLFKAAVNDEFEFLDAAGEWIHVQISGVSRGYIRRSALELPEVIAEHLEETAKLEAAAKQAAFRVEREENSVFPGDWEPLKGKTVKIYTVQPVSQDPKETDAHAKLNFAGSLMRKYADDTAGATAGDGVVAIFDSADGGIAGATLASIQQLAKGEISEEAFWKQCYLDPPETFQSKR
ncbi:MAG TPA: hypothetical protein VH140_07500 [Candidatus Acidoferrum sp.]|nr:hypothetical protein [Candidatus Acidoferrum sp.]